MKKFFIGQSPLTTLSGYILAILFVVRDLNMAGIHRWQDLILPTAIAIFGRLSGDDRNNRPKPPFPVIPIMPEGIQRAKPDTFLRRGKPSVRLRGQGGRFVPAS